MSTRVPDDMVSANERQQTRIAELEAEVERLSQLERDLRTTLAWKHDELTKRSAEVERLSRRPDLSASQSAVVLEMLGRVPGDWVPRAERGFIYAALRTAAEQEGR